MFDYIKKLIKNLMIYRWIKKKIYPIEKAWAKIDDSFPVELGINIEQSREISIVVSLTSFPERINYVSKTICSILHQSYKPDKVVLYLCASQFKDKEYSLPLELVSLQKYGLKIVWIEKDIKAYKKLIPALNDYPNAIVITADDDLYYPQYWIASLMESYKHNPEDIHGHLVTKIKCRKKDIIFQDCYRKKGDDTASYNYKILGGSGTLYPPNSLHKDVMNEDIFMKYAPTNDDIWFWIMAIKNDTKVRWIKNNMKKLYYVEGSQEESPCLYKENNEGPNYRLKQLLNLIEIYDINF